MQNVAIVDLNTVHDVIKQQKIVRPNMTITDAGSKTKDDKEMSLIRISLDLTQYAAAGNGFKYGYINFNEKDLSKLGFQLAPKWLVLTKGPDTKYE